MWSQGDPHSLRKEEEGGGGEERGRTPIVVQQLGLEGPLRKLYGCQTKPPYSYMALIALVIQASPEKKLKLKQILHEIEHFFPFFRAAVYQGWKASVKHSLYINPCFLEERTSDGIVWKMDMELMNPRALKRQNIQGPLPEGVEDPSSFVPDLAPFILHGEPIPSPPFPRVPLPKDLEEPQIKTPRKDGRTPFRTKDLLLGVGEEDYLLRDQADTNPCPGGALLLFHTPSIPSSCSWGQPLHSLPEEEKEGGGGGGERGRPPTIGQQPGPEGSQEEEEEEEEEGGGGVSPHLLYLTPWKFYRRHLKPPYTYVALIALAIQASPKKRLQMKEIVLLLEQLFPSFPEEGWWDSIQSSLLSNLCFSKEKSNDKIFWKVDVALIHPHVLKRKNTRGPLPEGAKNLSSFIPDLAPFILHGKPFPPTLLTREGPPRDPGEPQIKTPKEDAMTPFRIKDLLLRVDEEDSPPGDQRGPSPVPGGPPPLLHAPCLPPPCSWGQPHTFHGVGLAPERVADFPLPRPSYPLPLPPASQEPLPGPPMPLEHQTSLPCPPSGATPGHGFCPQDPTTPPPSTSLDPLLKEWGGDDGCGSSIDPGHHTSLPSPPLSPGHAFLPMGSPHLTGSSTPCASLAPPLIGWDGDDECGSSCIPWTPSPLSPSLHVGQPLGIGSAPGITHPPSPPPPYASVAPLWKEWEGDDGLGSSTDPGDQAPLPPSGAPPGHGFYPLGQSAPSPSASLDFLLKEWDGGDGDGGLGSSTDPGDQAPLPSPPSGTTPGHGFCPQDPTPPPPSTSLDPLLKGCGENDGHGSSIDPGQETPFPCPSSGSPPGHGFFSLGPTTPHPYASLDPLLKEWGGEDGHGSSIDPGDQTSLPYPPSGATPGHGFCPLGPTAPSPCAGLDPLLKEQDGDDGCQSSIDLRHQTSLPYPAARAPPRHGFFPLGQPTPLPCTSLDLHLKEWDGGDEHGSSTDPGHQTRLPCPPSWAPPRNGFSHLGPTAPPSCASMDPLLKGWDGDNGPRSSTDPGHQALLCCPPSGVPPGSPHLTGSPTSLAPPSPVPACPPSEGTG